MGLFDPSDWVPKEIKDPVNETLDASVYALNPTLAVQGDVLAGNGIDAYGNPVGSSNTNGNVSSRYEGPSAHLSLDPYTGVTSVPLTPELKRTLQLTDQILASPKYREMLNPEPNYEDMQTIYNQSRKNLEQYTLPGIDAAYSGGAYGTAYHGGERSQAAAQANLGLNEAYQRNLIDEKRYKEQLALQTSGFIPVAANVQSLELQNNIANLNREMQVHYANEGLKVTEFNADLAAIDSALGVAQYQSNLDMYNSQLELQREAMDNANNAALFSTAGGLIGGGLGMIGGPIGGMLGYGIGSSMGGMLSGNAAYAAPSMAQSSMAAMQSYYLYSMKPPAPTTGASVFGSSGLNGNYVLQSNDWGFDPIQSTPYR
jgi:hypothetical protein